MSDSPLYEPLPRPVRYLATALSALLLLSGLAISIAVAVLPPTPVWVVLGLEIVCTVAGVIGLLAVARRFDDGQGLAWACVSGTLLVAGFLSFLGTRQGIVFVKDRPPVSMTAWVAGRMLLGVAFGLIGAFAVLRRDPKCWKYAIRAALLGAPMLIVAGAAYVFRASLRAATADISGVIKGGVAALLGVVAIALFSACVHCVIRAFESGRREASGSTPPTGARSS